MVLTIPTVRFETSHNPEVTFKEIRSDAPPAIHALFLPHRVIGWEFIHPKASAGPVGTAALN